MENTSLTSRIIGAIVILSLGIIFIPILLETDNIDSSNMNQSPIPDMPSEISTIVFQLNEDTGKFEQEGSSPIEKFELSVAKEIANAENEVEMPDVVEAPSSNIGKSVEQKKPTRTQYSWLLQLASFKDRGKALKLRDELRAKKYVAHIAERKLESGSIWRVRIGPDLSRDNIQEIRKRLEKEMGLKGLIVRRR